MRQWVFSKRFLSLHLGLAMLFCLLPISNELKSNEKDIYIQVPVLKVNVYLMSQDKVDPQVYLNLGESFEYLNEEFEGQVGFQLNDVHVDYNGAFLPDLYSNYYKGGGSEIDRMVEPIEKKGAINLYVFNTYCEENTDRALMGFTPVLRSAHNKYEQASPSLDRIFMAYEGLENKTTLVHEMGHFLGQKHPWEMTEYDQKSLGILSHNEDQNHMTYGHQVDHFTFKQLDAMRNHAIKFRQYLAERVVRVSLQP